MSGSESAKSYSCQTAPETSAGVPSPAWAGLLPLSFKDALATAFLTSIEVRGFSRNTILAYGRALESLIGMAGDLDSLRLDVPTVHRYLAYLARMPSRHKGAKGECLARATIKQRLVALRAYADYLAAIIHQPEATPGRDRLFSRDGCAGVRIRCHVGSDMRSARYGGVRGW